MTEQEKQEQELEAALSGSVEPTVEPDEKQELSTDVEFQTLMAQNLGEGFGEGVSGALSISPSVPVPKIEDALAVFVGMENDARYKATVLRMWIGLSLNEIAAREDKDVSQVIDERNMVDATGRTLNTIMDWCRVATEFGSERVLPNLSISHYVKATRVSAPKDSLSAKTFRKQRFEVLKTASEHGSTSVRDVYDAVKDVREIVEPGTLRGSGKEPVSTVMMDLANTLRLLEASETDPTLLDRKGVTRRDLVDHKESCINDLVDRGEIIEDISKISLPWASKVIEA